MRKIILLIALIFTSILSAQRIGADVIKFSGKVTTAVRDGLNVPTGETWLIYNVTTGQFEKGNDAEVWEPFTGPGEGDVVSVNGKVGEVVLNPDDLDDTGSSHKFVTASLLAKLESIETGAQVNVQPDWIAISGDARILNKPTLGELAQKDNISASDIVGEGINGQVLTTNGEGEVTWKNKGASSFLELTGSARDNPDLASELDGKQNTLVSGTNIKTINSESLLGSGNITIEPGVSNFEDIEGNPLSNSNLAAILNSKAADSVVVKTSLDSQIQNLKLAVGDSAWIASKTFGANDIVINTDENPPGGDNYVTGGTLSGAGVLTLNKNYGSPIQIPGFNSGGGGGSVSWGGISGTIGDQTDMMALFDEKADNNSVLKLTGSSTPTGPWMLLFNYGGVAALDIQNESNFTTTLRGGSIADGFNSLVIDKNGASITLSESEILAKGDNSLINLKYLQDYVANNSGGDMLKSENLSGLANYTTARSNLGLGSLATLSSITSSNITDGTIVNADINASAAIAATKIADGSISNTEFQRLDNVTDNIQSQLNNKSNTSHTHTSSQITNFNTAVVSAMVGSDSGSTGLAVVGITGTHPYNTGLWRWYSVGKLVHFWIRIMGITDISTGNLVVDYSGTTLPNMKSNIGIFNVFISNIKDLDYQQIQATPVVSKSIGFSIKTNSSTSNVFPVTNADFTMVNPGTLEITGTYETD